MSATTQKMIFEVTARRLDAHGSQADCKDAQITLDTDMAGRRDAFNTVSPGTDLSGTLR